VKRSAWDRRAFIGGLVGLPFLDAAVHAATAEGGPALARQAMLSDHLRSSLHRICFLMFPHPEAGDGPYENAVEAIRADLVTRPDIASLVVEGVAALDGQQEGSWVGLPEPAQLAALERTQESPFFHWLYGRAIESLYNDERIWALIGYGGSSMEKGGYLERGFDDIDWLDR